MSSYNFVAMRACVSASERRPRESLASGRIWMVLLVSRAHRVPDGAQEVRRDRQQGMWEWRAGVEGAVSAQLLRHFVNTWS